MSIFKRSHSEDGISSQAGLAELALKNIQDGVIITNQTGIIQFINPAAITMTECGAADKAIGLDYGLLIKLETKEGRELPEAENPLYIAMRSNQPLDSFQGCLITGQSDQRIPIAISVLPTDNNGQNRIITFRNIAKELAEEEEHTEFISTASHEMRTPVATIDGYLSLALNPQTATIDERARGYLSAAEKASKHLGKLFQDLLDVTKMDDGKIKPHFEPTEMVSFVRSISNDYVARAKEAQLHLQFGTQDSNSFSENRRMNQVVYGFIDINFMREILDNLIENAIKYTPAGGSIYINVRGDGDRILINVTDTGIGISAEDLSHIFQKFYRVDNSDTRTIGGTGLGLYIVKQRAEAMGGRVWAESAFGEGSTFYVSLPRITDDEYEKRMIVVQNQRAQQSQPAQQLQPTQQSQPIKQPQLGQLTPQSYQTVSPPVQPSVNPNTVQPSKPPQSPPIQKSAPPIQTPPLPNLIPSTQAPPIQTTFQPANYQTNNNLNGVQQ